MILFYFIVFFSAVPNHPWFDYQPGGFTLIKYVGYLCFLYAILHSAMRGKVPSFFATWPSRFFCALFLLACVSSFTKGLQNSLSQRAFSVYFEYLILFLVTLAIVDSRKRLRYSLLAFIGTMGLGSLYTLREFQKAGFLPGYRPGYVVLDDNFFSAAALLAIPLAYYLMTANKARWERIFCLLCLTMTVLTVIVCASRGAFLGLSVCVLLMLIRSKQRARIVLLVIALIPILIYSPSSAIQRIMNPGTGEQTSTNTHLMVWKAGLTLAAKHPVSGIGLGNFWKTMQQENLFGANTGLVAHNTYLEYAVELGVFGLLLYVGILLSTYQLLEKVRKKAAVAGDAFAYAAARGIQAGIPGFAVAAFFFSAEYEKPLWIIVSLSVCMPNLIRSKRAPENKKELASVVLPTASPDVA